MKNYSDITVLLDRSGSMEKIKPAMESGFSEFLQDQKKVPSTRLTLIQFNSMNDQDLVFNAAPIESIERLVLTPSGGTPLLDAFCKAIDHTGRRLANMQEYNRPNNVIMMVITDGEENASRVYKRSDVNERVTRQSANYGWQFMYLGANQDSIQEAASFGIPIGGAINYGYNLKDVSFMFANASEKVRSSATASASGIGSSNLTSFTADERKEAVKNDNKTGG